MEQSQPTPVAAPTNEQAPATTATDSTKSADSDKPQGIVPTRENDRATRAKEREQRKAEAIEEMNATRRKSAGELAAELRAKREAPKDDNADPGKGKEKETPEPKTAKERAPDGKFTPRGDSTQADKEPRTEPARETQRDTKQTEDAELRASRAVREREIARNEAVTYRRQHETTSAELKTLKERIEKGKANPLDFIEDVLGMDFEAVARGVIEEKYKPRSKRMELPPEQQERISKLEQRLQAAEEKERTDALQRRQTRDEGTIKTWLESNPGRFPLVAATPWAVSDVVRRTYEQKLTDAEPILEMLEKQLSETTADHWFGNERALKAMLKRNPKLRETFIAALGVSKEATPEASNGSGKREADGPRSLSSVPAGNSPPPAKSSKAERKALAVEELAEKRRQRGA